MNHTHRRELIQALKNWGAYMRQDMELHGVSSQPVPPQTSQEFRAEAPGDPPAPPPDEEWAEQIQAAIVRLALQDTDAAMVLVHRYRDGRRMGAGRVAKSVYRLWRVMG